MSKKLPQGTIYVHLAVLLKSGYNKYPSLSWQLWSICTLINYNVNFEKPKYRMRCTYVLFSDNSKGLGASLSWPCDVHNYVYILIKHMGSKGTPTQYREYMWTKPQSVKTVVSETVLVQFSGSGMQASLVSCGTHMFTLCSFTSGL